MGKIKKEDLSSVEEDLRKAGFVRV